VPLPYLDALRKFKDDAFAVLTVVSGGWLKHLKRDSIIFRSRLRYRHLWESNFTINIKKFSTQVCELESSGTIAGVLNSVMQWLPFSGGSTATHQMQLRISVVTVVVALTR
jgi:hypothetical protein